MRFRTIIQVILLLSLQVSHSSAEEDANYISHGPVLGRVSSTGIGIWARTGLTGKFYVIYGTDSDNLDQKTKPVDTQLEHDNTAWIHITGLKPNTKYYYEIRLPESKGPTSRGGSFRTMPDSKEFIGKTNPDGLYNFSFEFACGNNQNREHSSGPSLPTFSTMLKHAKDKINFAILNGDWLYETQRDYRADQWLSQVHRTSNQTPKTVKVAPTIVGVWQNYKHFYNQAPNLRRWHSQVPSFFTYDDHEILNDVWGAGSPGLRDRRAVYRDVGVRAWYDYLGWSNPTTFDQPVHFGKGQLKKEGSILTDAAADFSQLDLAKANNLHVHWGEITDGVNDNSLDGVDGITNAGVYRIVKVIDKTHVQIDPPAKEDDTVSYSIGRRSYYRMRIANCDFFVTDTRGQRQMHDTQDPYKKGLSMLGPVQRDWLMKGVKESDADFIFIVSSVNLTVPHVGGGKVRATNKDDAWTVFYDEREKLINFWDSIDKPICVLTGDLHNSFVIKITDNVWEFASGPHNSKNHLASDEGDRPPNGKFKYGPREVDIRWSTYFHPDVPRDQLLSPTYCIVQINNTFENNDADGKPFHVAYPRPQVVFQYYDGKTGNLRYAESILANPKSK